MKEGRKSGPVPHPTVEKPAMKYLSETALRVGALGLALMATTAGVALAEKA